MGFRAGASADSLADALEKASGGLRPDVLAILADRARSPILARFAASLALPIIAIPRETLAGIGTVTYSPRVHAMLGTGSAAEALALAALAPGGRLIAPRALSQDRFASAAIAEGEQA